MATQQQERRSKKRPVHELRLGRIRAAVWENSTENGTRHNVTVSRFYKDGDDWRDSTSFGRNDLPLLSKVADMAHILDRLGLRRDGVITQAAQILFGTRFLPDYPQGRLKLGRFRGTKITGEILDNKQEYMHAFAMVREAMAFLDRTLPLSGHFVEGRIEREDRLPFHPMRCARCS